MTAPTHDLISPWRPITDPIDKKVLGKLLEELGEATSAAARCLIQGLDESDPTSGEINRQWLEKELADVQACIDVAVERFQMDAQHMAMRSLRKRRCYAVWHAGA